MTSRVRAIVDIDAPVDEVFEFFDDVGNASVLVPNLIDVQKVEPLTSGGRRIEYTTRGRNGEVIDASSEHAEHEPPRRTVTKGVQSGVSTTSTREFDTIAYGVTRVSATVEWSVPVRYVAKIVEYPLRGPFRRSLREMLLAAKDAIETA